MDAEPVIPGSRRASAATLAVGVLLISSCGDGSGALTDVPLSARGHAAVGCDAGAIVIWSGGAPSGTAVGGGALLSADVWEVLADAPLEPRLHAAALLSGGRFLVWGGVTADSRDAAELEFSSDGAVYSLEDDLWTLLPEAPLAARIGGRAALVSDTTVLVYGGSGRVGSARPLDAATYDLATGGWAPAPPPPDRAVVARAGTTVYAVGPAGVAERDAAGEWSPVGPAPGPVERVTDVAAVGGLLLVVTDLGLFSYDPTDTAWSAIEGAVDAAEVLTFDDEVVVWSQGGPAAWSYRGGGLSALDVPDALEAREGAASCLVERGLLVWGGWLLRDTARVGSDHGYLIARR